MKLARLIYHYLLALGAAVCYRFPARQLFVIGITGTKGKTTTAELVSAILTAAGRRVAVSSTLHFKIGERSERNLKKMSMPGRGFIQKLLRRARRAGCDTAVIEMTSEGARQFRHKFLALDALIFTNLSPEHLESHGSFEKYRAAKLAIVRELARSPKPNKIIVVNGDDAEAPRFLAAADCPATGRSTAVKKIIYRRGEGREYPTHLPGDFNRANILAAAALARALGVPEATIEQTLRDFPGVRGRMENIGTTERPVIIDYAHTPDSLEKVYQTLKTYHLKPCLAGRQAKTCNLICVLGGTGGGRDSWKRPVMGGLADTYCDKIFLTDEDPYDEEPRKIVDEVAGGIKNKNKLAIIMDRREAIRAALRLASSLAQGGDNHPVVIITGKGTDPFIMGPRGSKLPWDDAQVAREELAKLRKF